MSVKPFCISQTPNNQILFQSASFIRSGCWTRGAGNPHRKRGVAQAQKGSSWFGSGALCSAARMVRDGIAALRAGVSRTLKLKQLGPSAVSKDMLVQRFQAFASEVLVHPVHE